MPATPIQFEGWDAVALESADARLIAIPRLGGKIASLSSLASGREFLWRDPTRPYRLQTYGDDFGNYDASGFDECFPSIGACPYPGFPWDGIEIPDHGELWCIPWNYELLEDETLYMHAHGIRFPYSFEKWITPAQNQAGFTLRYRISNHAPFPFTYLWSAHPLFAAEPGMRIIFPSQPQVRLTFALGDRVQGELLQEYTWPWLQAPNGIPLDYSLIGTPDLNANDKVYANAPPEGWCGLYQPQTGEYLALTFLPEQVPFVGVCINHGGWPFSGVRGYWVALEPCTGYPDRLDHAIEQAVHRILPAYGQAEWTIGLYLGQQNPGNDIVATLSRYKESELKS